MDAWIFFAQMDFFCVIIEIFSPSKKKTGRRALNFLKSVIKSFWRDGLETEAEEIQNTLSKVRMTTPTREPATFLQTTVCYRPIALELSYTYSPTEVASQLTLIDYNMLRKITEDELCSIGWDKKDDTKSANVNAMVDRWNKVSMWVSSEIIYASDKMDKHKLIKWFIILADKLLDMKNYHTMMAIVAGVNTLYVSRVNEIKLLGNKTRQRKQYLESIMSAENNWGNYRERLKKSDGLVIPYLGLCMKDVFIVLEDKHKTQSGRYNWAKLRILQQILSQFFRFRNQECSIDKIPVPENYLCHLFIKSEQDLDDLTNSKHRTLSDS